MEKDGNSSVTKTKRGRPKKYATEEERKAALAAQRSRYYQDHKPEYNERAKKHYYKYREEILAKQKTLKARMQKSESYFRRKQKQHELQPNDTTFPQW